MTEPIPVKVADGKTIKSFERKSYDRVASTYGAGDSEGADEGRRRLLSSINVSTGGAILDICCGPGWLTIEASRLAGPEGTTIGVDLSPAMQAEATSNAGKVGSPARFQVMDAERLEFPDASFDAVLCSYGLMHIPDPELAASEMARVLKPGGRLALRVWATPDRSVFLGVLAQSLRSAGGDSLPIDYGYITRLGAPGVLEQLLVDAGFSGVKVELVENSITMDTAMDFWEGFQRGAGMFTMLLEALNDDQRAAALSEYLRISEDYVRGDKFVLPSDYLMATAGR